MHFQTSWSLQRFQSQLLFESKCLGWGWHLPFADGPTKSQLLLFIHSGQMTEVTQISLQLAQWCFLKCEVGPWNANFWEIVVGYFSGKESVIPLERDTLAPNELLLCKTGTVPGSGLVLNAAAVSLLDYKSNYLIVKAHYNRRIEVDLPSSD